MRTLNSNKTIFIDVEVDLAGNTILDLGAIKGDGSEFHSDSTADFRNFLRGAKYVCGHNIIKHDLKYIEEELSGCGVEFFVDTLYLSPLLFPKKPYHRLLKDDKLLSDELNNPLNDAKKARDLLHDEVTAFRKLNQQMQQIYAKLLGDEAEFKHFFSLVGYKESTYPQSAAEGIFDAFAGKICERAPIEKLAGKYPVELAYALALVGVMEYDCTTPPWVLKNYPRVENVMHFLRSRKCQSCAYCGEALDETKALRRFFHYDSFRTFDGVDLQQSAVKAAIKDESLLTIFPTGGGKSITFQLPALMAGRNERGLTVVISPLQSLMKDQIDNLEKQHNITDAVTINSSLDPVDRANAFERVEDGSASILYISPESLRSKSIERILLGRNVVRFVIDEAHCFSSWGHDFRVDYLYIGDFIRSLQEKKGMPQNIPVSCFTATAKQRVIDDIQDYFRDKLSLELKVFRAKSSRINLSYHVFNEDDTDEKDDMLRQLLSDNDCPTIVYVSRTRRAERLALKLTDEGFPAKPYHGRMDRQLRVENQNSFMSGEVKIIVATTAFGMGVDKNNIGMVIHYDISASLEDYVQEAGRAGRDESITADCYILFSEEDLDKHFTLLNQTKMSRKEIQQVWRALKELTRSRASVSQSALEIARASGWDDSVKDMETRITTAINALEQSGFIRRGQNMPRIYADSILVRNMIEAKERIDKSARFDDASRVQATRIIGNLISAKSKTRGSNEDGESRVDYISDRLGIVKEDVIRVIGLLREEKILADAKDLIAFIKKHDKSNLSKAILHTHKNIENFLAEYLDAYEQTYNVKEMNEALQAEFTDTSINQLYTIINYYSIKRFIKRTQEYNKNHMSIKPYFPLTEIHAKSEKRCRIAETIIDYLFMKAIGESAATKSEDAAVEFSVLELKAEYDHNLLGEKAEREEIEDALYYLLKIGAMKIDGGFLVIYNAMHIERLRRDQKTQYKKEDYAKLEEHYSHKRQQIHIVGEYAKRLADDYDEAMEFVDDYFKMDYDIFLQKYFKGRKDEISRNITPQKFKQLFGELSPAQLKIINDQKADYIVVAAGPGSGKTKLLTHKLASLIMMEDVKHEQMLMLTFSRAAATEFKRRLMTLIGNAANFIQIMTFHSYCFDLLGKVGDLEKSDRIIEQTIEKINSNDVDVMRLTKTVLVIDEAQDMSLAEYSLVKILIDKNSGLRVIAVGDDDQNIYQFRGSSSEYFESIISEPGAKKYELVDNYRSVANIVDFANQFAATISHRFKTLPIMPRKSENGCISVCKLTSNNVVTPVVSEILNNRPTGQTCVVTRTNEEALNITGLLMHEGVPARLIQTNNDFSLNNLVELRFFVDYINMGDSYTISDEVWEEAKSELCMKFGGSGNLQGVLKLLGDYEDTNNKTKYKSDFKQFIRESKLEDFISGSEGVILVSTIHQTKGREFDNVYLALSRFPGIDDEKRRAVYVAITRAKQNLHIFCNGSYFDKIDTENTKRYIDEKDYPEPSILSMQLSHKDVHLSYFINRKREIDSLISGQTLAVRESGCYLGDKRIIKFSASYVKKIEDMERRGFSPVSAHIRHIVYWQDKRPVMASSDKRDEIKIVLPDIEFSTDKRSDNVPPE